MFQKVHTPQSRRTKITPRPSTTVPAITVQQQPPLEHPPLLLQAPLKQAQGVLLHTLQTSSTSTNLTLFLAINTPLFFKNEKKINSGLYKYCDTKQKQKIRSKKKTNHFLSFARSPLKRSTVLVTCSGWVERTLHTAGTIS